MDTVGFRFPKIGDTCANGIGSPPLWNISPQGPSNPNQVLREGRKGDAKVVSKGHKRCSSCVEDGRKITRVDGEAVPMDLLWEVFNEKLSSATQFSSSSSSYSSSSSSREMVEFTGAKTSTALLQTKNRPEIGFDKVLQKAYPAVVGMGSAPNSNG